MANFIHQYEHATINLSLIALASSLLLKLTINNGIPLIHYVDMRRANTGKHQAQVKVH